MSKHREILYGQPVPQSFFDAFQEFISTLSANFALTLAPGSNNQVQVVAGNGNAQVGIGIDGLWRYNSATNPGTQTTSVTGAAGIYDLFVTCGDNSFTTNPAPPPAPPELDGTNYTFGLTAVATGQTPTGVAHSRRVGQAVFDGTRILSLRQLVGQVDGAQLLQPGMIQLSAAPAAPPGWLLCNGQAVLRAGPTGYAALYAALGGTSSAWGQGDGSTTFNVPDLRGRVPVGVGTAQGVAPATNRVLGVPDGAEQIALAVAQLPSHGHSMDFMSQSEDRDHQHLYPGAAVSGGPSYAFQDGGAWTNVLVGPGGGYGFANGTGSHWDLQTLAYPYSGNGQVPAAWTTARNTGHLHEIVGNTAPVGSNGLVGIVQPVQVVNYLIKT